MRTRRSDPAKPGFSRRRQGKGFRYIDAAGEPLPPDEVARIKNLVIPPAWTDVWICPDPLGHIQAVGTDAAGRRQYRYHDAWRENRDRQKFDHVLRVAGRLPRIRRSVRDDLGGRGLSRRRVLATVAGMLDLGRLRVGGDQYAEGDDATFGVATLQAGRFTVVRGRIDVCFPAMGGIQRELSVEDPDLTAVVKALLRIRAEDERLFAWRSAGPRNGNGLRDVHASDVNEYLREIAGLDVTAKDFRTWHATVSAAVLLAKQEKRTKRAGAGVMKEVAEELGNTPAVARASYVDPRVVERFNHGETTPRPVSSRSAVERQVRELLT